MTRTLSLFIVAVVVATSLSALAQVQDFEPVTREMLLNPDPGDWLMLSRTYDMQRFSPLDQINRQNVGRLRMSWARGMSPGIHEHIPLVYRGVMYVANPGGLQALDATTGDLIWDYRRDVATGSRSRAGRTMSIYQDVVIYAAPDDSIVGVDARSGKVRWETESGYSSSGPNVIDGKVMAGIQSDRTGRAYVIALDAGTGAELWRFYTTAAPGEPGGDSWGDVPVDQRIANPWGLPGSYDPVRGVAYWGIANPTPYTRLTRHAGDPDAISRSAPADLYSNSTVALDPDTGELAWYYQHLPGDDWDADHTHERILLRTPVNPDSDAVKWIKPGMPQGEERDVMVTVGEPGGIWALDRETGEFLWATPFPYDVPDFHISHIDVETGATYINWDKVFKKDGDRVVVCYHNTKGYWPMAYHPGQNSLYIQYNDQCLDMTANEDSRSGFGPRNGILRPGADPNQFGGLAKMNMATGEVVWRYTQPAPTNGAVLATAGDLVFWGDMNRRLRAFDADSGQILWETVLGGIVQMSTITYSVSGTQYVAVLTGDGGAGTRIPLQIAADLNTPGGHNAIYVFALP